MTLKKLQTVIIAFVLLLGANACNGSTDSLVYSQDSLCLSEDFLCLDDPFALAYKDGLSILYYGQHIGDISFVFSNGSVVYIDYSKAPVVTSGNNKHWFINGIDTGISMSVKPVISEMDGLWAINHFPTKIEANSVTISENGVVLECIIQRTNCWEFHYSNGIVFQIEYFNLGFYWLFRSSRQYGKTMAVFGGSIAHGAKECIKYWEQYLGLKIVNYARGGYGFAREGSQIREIVDEVCDGDALFDIYLFWCSTNDISYQVGDVTSYSESDNYSIDALKTQNGGINYCIKRIYERNPKAKILFFTSLPCFYTRGFETEAVIEGRTYLFQLVKGQIDCCEKWGIPYYDQFSHSLFDVGNYQLFFSDKVHPSNVGYELIKTEQAIFIATVF